jgi:DNA repair exonuclease SbcCD ATPase subunit
MADTTQLAGGNGAGSQPDAALDEVPVAGTNITTQNDKGKPGDLSKYVPVEDLRRMQSTYDKQLAASQKQYTQLESQFKELQAWREKNETAGLTDEELAAYQMEKAQYEASQTQQEARQKIQELEYEKNKLALQKYYIGNGAPDSIFEGTDDPAEWQDNLIKFLKKERDDARNALAKAQKSTTDPKAPTVTTHKPAAGSLGKIKINDISPFSKEYAEVMAKLDRGQMTVEDLDFS